MDPDTTMDTELIIMDLVLAPRGSIEIQGTTREVSSRFQINIGQDPDNLALHFCPRFKDDPLTVALNSRKQGNWEAEIRTVEFPFKASDHFKVIINFDGEEFLIISQDSHHVTFPNRTGLNVLNYLEVIGNVDLQLIKLTN